MVHVIQNFVQLLEQPAHAVCGGAPGAPGVTISFTLQHGACAHHFMALQSSHVKLQLRVSKSLNAASVSRDTRSFQEVRIITKIYRRSSPISEHSLCQLEFSANAKQNKARKLGYFLHVHFGKGKLILTAWLVHMHG